MKGWNQFNVATLLFVPVVAWAGTYTCAGVVVPESTRTCPDGTIPMYQATVIQPAPRPVQPVPYPTQPTATPSTPTPPPAPAAVDVRAFFGVWHTNVPGAVWTTTSNQTGYDRLHVSAGVAAGSLVIKANGTYTWASYGGKSGKWEQGGADSPIVLIDTVEKRRWQISFDRQHPDGKHIYIWDGNAYYYSGQR